MVWALLPLFVLAPPLVGQEAEAGRLRGTVTDAETGTPILGVEVRADNTRAVGLTDARGRFVLRALPAGNRTIRFSWLGYRDRTVEVRIHAGTEAAMEVSLDPEPVRLGDVVVTSVSRRPERVVESPAAVSVVPPARRADLRATGQTPLLIRDLPGVHVMQSGVNSFNVNARAFNGLVNRRLLVLVDGRDVSVPLVGSQEWPAVSGYDTGTRVELIRGPGSALYGANAYSGVLNIVTPTVRQAQGARITVSGGDPLSLRADARYGWLSRDLRWGVRASAEHSRDRSWDRSRTNLGDLAREYAPAIDPTRVTAPPPGFEAVPLAGQSLAGGGGPPMPATGTPDPLLVSRGSVRVERYLDEGGVLTAEGGLTVLENQVGDTGASRSQIGRSERPWARFEWAEEDVNVMGYYAARTADQVNLATGQIIEDWSDRFHVEGLLRRNLMGGRARVSAGASFRSETIDSRGGILAAEHDGRTDEFYALFGQADVEVTPSVRLIVAARLDDASLFDPEFSPKVGGLWSPTEDQSLRFTVGRAYLMPTAAGRFVRFPLGPPQDLSAVEEALRQSPLGPALSGVPEGELLTESAAVPLLAIGNQKQGPEEVTSVELGYKGQLGRLFLAADLHRSSYQDFSTSLLPWVHPDFPPWTAPAAVPAGARDPLEGAVRDALPGITRLEDGRSALVFSSSTAGRATQWGVDVTLGVQLTTKLRIDGNHSYVTVDFEEGSFVGGDSIPTNTPTHTTNLSAAYTVSDDFRARVGLRLVDGYHFEMVTLAGWVPARQSVDLSAAYRLAPSLSANLSITNLLDQKRYHYFGGSLVERRGILALTWEP